MNKLIVVLTHFPFRSLDIEKPTEVQKEPSLMALSLGIACLEKVQVALFPKSLCPKPFPYKLRIIIQRSNTDHGLKLGLNAE
jgi:hypothetical protein